MCQTGHNYETVEPQSTYCLGRCSENLWLQFKVCIMFKTVLLWTFTFQRTHPSHHILVDNVILEGVKYCRKRAQETGANIHWVYILVTMIDFKHVCLSDWTSSVEYEFCPTKKLQTGLRWGEPDCFLCSSNNDTDEQLINPSQLWTGAGSTGSPQERNPVPKK